MVQNLNTQLDELGLYNSDIPYDIEDEEEKRRREEEEERLRRLQELTVASPEPDSLIQEYSGLLSEDTGSDVSSQDIISGGQGQDVLIGQAAQDNLQNELDAQLFKGIEGFGFDTGEDQFLKDLEEQLGSPLTEDEPETFTEWAAETATDVGEYTSVAAKMGTYGLLRRGVLGTAEFIAQSPEWAIRFIEGTKRGIEEAGRFAFAALLPKSLEKIISRTVWNTDRNVFDYQDMFDTQTDITRFFDQYVYGAINAGYDLITTEKEGDRLITVTDEFGQVQKGDYVEFVDYVFKGLEVPLEKQNFLGRVLMTGGEFIVPMGVLRTARGRIGETVMDQIKKYSKEITLLKKDVRRYETERIRDIMLKQRMPKGPKPFHQKTTERALRKSQERLQKLKFEQRHYTAGTTSAEIGKRLENTGAVTFKDVLKSEGNMALGAATAMVTAEVAMEEMGLEEFKPAALIFGLAGGMAGISSVKGGLTSLKHLTLYAFKGVLEGQSPETADHYLRWRGYSEESIKNMTNEEKVQIAVSDPKQYKIAREIGAVLEGLKRGDEADRRKYEEIKQAVAATEKLTRRFNLGLMQDKADGLISGKDFNYVMDTLPVLLDQVVQISALSKLRDTLLKNTQLGGFTLNAKKVATVKQLDKMTQILETQQRQLLDSLGALEKKIGKSKGTTESNTRTYMRYTREFVDNYKKDHEFLEREIDRIKRIKDTDVDPLNTHKFREDMDAVFGEEDMNSISIANKLERQGHRSDNLDEEAHQISSAYREDYGEKQVELIEGAFRSLKRQADEAYADVEDFDIDIDDLFWDNNYAEELIEASSSLKRYQPDTRAGAGRLESLVRDARELGLRRVRSTRLTDENGKELINPDTGKAFTMEENPDIHLDALIEMDISHKELTDINAFSGKFSESGELMSVDQAKAAYRLKIHNLASETGYENVIKNVERELIGSDVFKITTDSSTGLTRHEFIGRNVTTDEGVKSESVIPAYMSFKDLVQIRSTAMANAFVRNPNTGELGKKYPKRLEANAFVVTLNKKISRYLDKYGYEDLGITSDSYAKLRQADTLYANTLGKTFKRRLGTWLKKQAEGETVETIDSVANHELFHSFLNTADPEKAADMFKRMFTGKYVKNKEGVTEWVNTVDADGNPVGEIHEGAKRLLLTALRVQLTSNAGRIRGLKDLDDNFLEHFLTGEKGIHLFKGKSAKEIKNFMNWRRKEANYFDNEGKFNVPIEEMKYRETLQEALESLFEDRKLKLDQSFFGEKVPDNFDQLIRHIFDRDASYHAAREPLNHFEELSRRADSNVTKADYDRLRNNYETVTYDDKYLTGAKWDEFDDASQMVGPPIRPGALDPKSPVEIILETLEDLPAPKQKEVREALKGLFVEYISRRAYTFKQGKKWAANEGEYAFELVRDVDLGEFTRVMKENEGTLKTLFKDDPEQLERLQDILQLETMFKGEGVKATKLADVGFQLKPSSLMSRVYSISRGVISPKYVATEIAIAKAQVEKGNFMLKVLMDPNTTKVVSESMAIAAGKLEATPVRMERLKRVAFTIFYAEMGEDYPVEVKSSSWLKEQLQFVPNMLDEIRMKSKREELGITEKQDKPYVVPTNTFNIRDMSQEEIDSYLNWDYNK